MQNRELTSTRKRPSPSGFGNIPTAVSAIILVLIIAVSSVVTLTGCGGSSGSSNPVSPSTAPSILNVSPTTGSPGTQVTIQGTGFGILQGTSTISYAGVTLTPNAWSNTQIVVTIPSNTVTGGGFIVNVAGQVSNTSTAFTLTDPQLITINPTNGLPGTQVTLTGKGFGTAQGRSYVAFNGQIAQVTTWSDSYIVCIVPTPTNTSPGSVSVVVWIDGSKSTNSLSFTIQVPTISTINPLIDNVGALITITGSGFGAYQSQVNGQISIGGITATVVAWSDTSIQARVPQVGAAGAQQVIITSNGRSSSPMSITVAAPYIESQSPRPAIKNDVVTLTGNYFSSSSDSVTRSVTLDGSAIANPVWNDTSLSFTCPIGGYLGQEYKTLTVTVGGLTTTFSLYIE